MAMIYILKADHNVPVSIVTVMASPIAPPDLICEGDGIPFSLLFNNSISIPPAYLICEDSGVLLSLFM